MIVDVIKGASITVSLCILTKMGGRKNDSYLIAIAGVSFILIALLQGINSTAAAVEASAIGQFWTKLLGFLKLLLDVINMDF